MRDHFPMPLGHIRGPGIAPGELQLPRRFGGFGIAHAVFPWLFLLLFAALVAVAILALVRFWKMSGRSQAGGLRPPDEVPRTDPALQELRARYAQGTIDREEFLQKSADLGEARPAPPPPKS